MSADDARRRFDEATRAHLLAPLPRAFGFRVDGSHAAALRAAGVKIP